MRRCAPCRAAVLLSAAVWPVAALAQTQTIRVVTYNTQGDVSSPSPTGVLPYLATVIEGIGQQKYVGDGVLQLPDVVALQEATSNSTTVTPLVSDLNTYYGSNIFGYSSYQATTSDGVTSGGGPNALIYNQLTMNLIASVGVGTPESGTNGVFRQPVRYEFQPLVDAGTNNGIFYVYNDHYKSGGQHTSADGSTDGNLRGGEALLVRNDEAANLPANAAVLYVGDYNLDGSFEPMYQTLTAANAPSGQNPGQGAGIDPLNPTNNYTLSWSTNAPSAAIMTDSDSKLQYRDDLQLLTSNVYNDTPGNLDYIANSYHAFGNNGTSTEGLSINNTNNTSLNDIIGHGTLTPSQVLSAMNASLGSDHLPVVADYTQAIPTPSAAWLGNFLGSNDWSAGANWGGESVPNQATELVSFGPSNTSAATVNLNGSWTVGTVNFASSNSYTLASGSAGGLTFDNGTSTAQINVFSGTHTISAPVSLNSTLNIVMNSVTNALTMSGSISGAGGVTQNGPGAVTLSGVNSYTSGTIVNAGNLAITNAGGLPPAGPVLNNSTVTVLAGTSSSPVSPGTITGSGLLAIGNLLGTTPGYVQLAANSQTSAVGALTINPGSTLDIQNNTLDINFGSPGNDPISTIVSELSNGYNGAGAWTGTSATGGVITSSTAAAGGKSVSVGYLDGNIDTTDSSEVAPNQIVVKYTLTGDTNLDGIVNFTDFATVLKNFAQPGTDWAQGNFTYNPNSPSIQGTNFTDFADVLANFLQPFTGGSSGETLGGTIEPLTTTVRILPTTPVMPEPGSLSLVSCGAVALLRRRRRMTRALQACIVH